MENRTNRLIIKPFSQEDMESALDLLTDNSIKQTYMLPDFTTREDAIPLFLRLMALSTDGSRFVRGIYLDHALIGFLNDVEIKSNRIELGYVIAPDRWNRGYCTEAVKALIAALFDAGFDEVAAGAFEHNAASMRVMEKVGMMRLEKTEEIEYRGKLRKVICYSIRK